MISSEVQRTLVKSPPELWSELSDPAALTKHLGELGKVRITRLEPERAVEWEAEVASGKVELKPSGWGTKVTLSLQREPEAAEEPEPEKEPEAEEELEAEEETPQPKLGFFARLFRRKPGPEPEPDGQDVAVEAQQQDVELEAKDDDLAAELKAAEEALEAESVALLNGVLDRLGAAHHRPFSRA